MTKEQFDSLYYGKAIHCDTEEKAKEFLALADSVGYTWFGDAEAHDFTNWQIFKEDTHYFVKEFWCVINIEIGNSNYYLKYDIDCVEFIPQSQKLKIGDKVRVKNTIFTDINGKVGVIIEKTNSLNTIPYLVKIDHTGWPLWFYENQLEKVEEPTHKVETTETLIDEIKAKWSEINILLNRLEEKERYKRK